MEREKHEKLLYNEILFKCFILLMLLLEKRKNYEKILWEKS